MDNRRLGKFSKRKSVKTQRFDENMDEKELKAQCLKRRKGKSKQRTVDVDEASRLKRRARNLLIRLKLEQNLIDAYSGEGWKGQSREKIKPEKELQRAKKQILKCKLGIRDIIRQLDLLGSEGRIEESLIASDGSVHHEHIFCKVCKSQEASEDNDIILCDGTCNCAFHQKCIDPPLATENIPPEDEGWLCKYCQSKMEILDSMNAHLGTEFLTNSTWQDIFQDEASLADGGTGVLMPENEWPDDDSEDNDYDPDGVESNSCSRNSREGSGSDGQSTSDSLCPSLESEVYSESVWAEINRISSNACGTDCADAADQEVVSGPRQRSAVDYRKLYHEMFGKDATLVEQLSEDEDWGPRKRRRGKESDAATTLMTLCESDMKGSESKTIDKEKKLLSNSRPQKSFSRIPVDAVKKLRQAFAENELPSKAVKERVAEQLGLEYEKVNKWFKNARYIALKTRKAAQELSDDMSLKKHLLHLKAKARRKKSSRTNAKHQTREAEAQMERLCRIEVKLRKLKQILLRLNSSKSYGSNEPNMNKQPVIYVPVAVLKEKI